MNTACLVINRTGPSVVAGKSPNELWFGKGPSPINHFKAFGSTCFVHVPKQKRQKWSAKSFKGMLVGYCGERDGFRVYNGRIVLRSADVIFPPEKSMVTDDLKNSEETQNRCESKIQLNSDSKEAKTINPESTLYTSDSEGEENSDQTSDLKEEETILTTRSGRVVKTPTKLKDYVYTANGVPNTCEALNSAEWRSAMEDEMKSLTENDVFEVVERPRNKKIIGNRWVLREKTRTDGTTERLKARLVAKGYSQQKGIDFEDTFSPVARFETVRTVLSVAAKEKLILQQFDVKTAFLYGCLNEEIYMDQPEGYEDGTDMVWKLKKGIYGLKQSPRCWNERLTSFMEKQNFNKSKSDPCLYVRQQNGNKLIVVCYVDDGLLAGTDMNDISNFVAEMKKEFSIRMVSPDCYLGITIQQKEDGSIFLRQQPYIENLLKKFGMDESKPVKTPAEVNENIQDSEPLDKKVPFREAVGSLIYLMTGTRPDLAYAVNNVAQDIENPTTMSWRKIKRIFRYLQGTKHYGLLYKSSGEGDLIGFCDADYASDKSRHSRSGIFCVYAGSVLTWSSQKQKSVSVSTMEAEYISASEAAKQLVWLERLLREITSNVDKPKLYIDNVSAVRLAKNPEFHFKSKHIDVRYHFVREKVNSGELEVLHISGEEQLADVLTKALPGPRFNTLLMKIITPE